MLQQAEDACTNLGKQNERARLHESAARRPEPHPRPGNYLEAEMVLKVNVMGPLIDLFEAEKRLKFLPTDEGRDGSHVTRARLLRSSH